MLELDPRSDAVAPRFEREDVGEQTRRLISVVFTSNRVAIENILDVTTDEPTILRSVELNLGIRLFISPGRSYFYR